MRPLAIHHVSVTVGDVDAARRFYVDLLGMAERSDRPQFGFAGAWLDAGGQQLHLIAGDPPGDARHHFAVLVDDLAAVVAELRAAGVRVGDPRPVGSSLQTFVSDPDGNLVELHQAASGVVG